MTVLGDRKILKEIKSKSIVIEPFDLECLGSNSYDVHLGKTLSIYQDDVLDAARPPKSKFIEIPQEGYVLHPNELYLGATMEYTESHKYLPWIDGKSSVGRLGIFIHATAGRGDVGFMGHFTLEIMVVKSVRVYAGMPIGQLTYMRTTKIDRPYNKKKTAKYNNRDPRPMPSRMWLNFNKKD